MNACLSFTTRPRAIKIAVRTLVLFAAIVLSACNAQSPGASSASGPTAVAAAPLYREPAITGRIVDKETLQPIADAFVYGFYITHGGGTLAGGSKIGEPVKSFLTQTDANGVWRLDAWDTGTREVGGVMGAKFPVLSIYKPGYNLWFDQMSGVKQYRPKSDDQNTSVTVHPDGTLDWTPFAHRLVPAATENQYLNERYEAMYLSSHMMMFIGDCGWELYAPLLLAQHNEWKGILRRGIPAEFLDADGYAVSGLRFVHPHPEIGSKQQNKSVVDNLRTAARLAGAPWGCAQPDLVFKGRK